MASAEIKIDWDRKLNLDCLHLLRARLLIERTRAKRESFRARLQSETEALKWALGAIESKPDANVELVAALERAATLLNHGGPFSTGFCSAGKCASGCEVALARAAIAKATK